MIIVQFGALFFEIIIITCACTIIYSTIPGGGFYLFFCVSDLEWQERRTATAKKFVQEVKECSYDYAQYSTH